jgi:hypothetical protein
MISAMVRRLSLVFGLLIGGMWMGEIILGNLGDTAVLGNYRTVHSQAYRTIGWCFIGGALAATALGGFICAYRTGSVEDGISVGIWSGVLSGAVALVTGLVLTLLFRDALMAAPSNIAEFAKAAHSSTARPAEFSRYLYRDAVIAGLNHMWIGALLGVTLGGVGAVLGKLIGR